MTPHGIEMLKFHEGIRTEAYLDTVGVWTIGFGHTSDRHKEVKQGMKINLDEAHKLLVADLSEAEADARRLVPNFNELSPKRQDALINMAFQLGYFKLSKFTQTLNYIRTGRFSQAAENLTRTLWYKQTQRDRTAYIIDSLTKGG